jgi:methionine salvage enolase-phosphatase E1
MNLEDFNKKLSEFYDELKSIADEAVGGFAIDSLHGSDGEKKKKKKIINPLEEGHKHNRVMIDFDKTIYSAKSGWDDGNVNDDPFPDAKKSIEFLKDKGYEIVIFTSRASQENAKEFAYDLEDEIQNVKNYLSNHGIYFDRITGEKLAADFYIDDKVIRINNGNWNNVISQIKKLEKSI